MKKKIFVLALLLLVVVGSTISIVSSHQSLYSGDILSYKPDDLSAPLIEDSYLEYKQTYDNLPIIMDDSIAVDVIEDIDSSLTDMTYFLDDGSVVTDEEGTIGWSFNVNETGLYHIQVEYEQVISLPEFDMFGKSAAAERILRLNGEIPFNEASNVSFSRIWEDETDIIVNQFGSEVRPNQIEKPRPVKTLVQDINRVITEPYLFYFEAGTNTISLESIREPLIINSINLVGKEPVPHYEEALSQWIEDGYSIVENAYVEVQAETMYEKNSPTMIPLPDTSSMLTTPKYTGKNSVLNVMGVYSWRLPGYWVSYEVEVPKSGLYALNFRMKQDIKQGSFVSRYLTINGQVPFQEAKAIPFVYNSSFNNYVIGTEDEPYLFYLEEGRNVVQFDVSLGNVGELINQVTTSMNSLNQLYLDIIMYTSVTPQLYRDYQLATTIENLEETIATQHERLEAVIESFDNISEGSRNQTAILANLTMQLERFMEDPEIIVRELASFESNISALGTWITQEQEQPLTLDHFSFFDPNNTSLSRGKDNVLESFYHETRRFLYSFINNDDNFSGSGEGDTTIRIWVTAGRDQAQILRRIIDDSFHEGINVDLELVARDVLLRAAVAGEGPDIALMVPEGTPIDFAFRNAAYDLTDFDDFDSIATRFHESAMTPFSYNDGYYALPEQHTFPVLFYRSDILEQLDIEVPNNWDETLTAMSMLNMNNLDFFMESGSESLAQMPDNIVKAGFYGSLLYQHGGEFYLNDGKETGLLTPEAGDAFRMFTQFFTSYGLPTQANFVNRFRSGEIAMGIADYALYNTLVVFAPEISGKWAIAPVPGFSEDNNVVASNVPFSSMILKDTEYPEASWEFLKWWTSTETQVEYARELETVMGAAARYPTANQEALALLSWPTRDLQTILQQQENTRGIPQVPGGYMTTRQFTYAYLAVVNNGLNPLEVLNEYAREINREIDQKRREFELD